MRWWPVVSVSVFIVAFLPYFICGQILATGGGVVKVGQDLDLKYKPSDRWENSCTWFWFKDPKQVSRCSFNMLKEGQVKLHSCHPENPNQTIEYIGTSNEECAIKVKNLTEDDDLTWEVRVDFERQATSIPITVAKAVKSGEITVQNYLEGESGNVTCSLHGGKPAPAMSLQISGLNASKIVDNSQVQTEQPKSKEFESVATFNIKPTADDLGRTVSCRSAIFDKDNKSIFEYDTDTVKLNVLFAPKEMADQIVKVDENQKASVSIAFLANPEPTKIQWIVGQSSEGGSNETVSSSEDLILSPGDDSEKYKISEMERESDVKFRANLTINKVQLNEKDKEYRLLVRNEVGTQTYNFTLDVRSDGMKGNGTGGSNGTQEGSNDNGSGSGGSNVAIVLIVVAIAIMIMVSFFVYRSKKPTNETTPLQGGGR
ncbi:hypothetical protein TCAL_15047 [Tigriopus californicus]|uniref:CD80-like immunoglobulin C2-set domain-containing protein n=1 Tax=Tigriopus californicus TaxID=6832 RepID=A0A553NYX2_TIGCA|nr:hypothetical protein TCAL_15047 [Tigriopus californicus]